MSDLTIPSQARKVVIIGSGFHRSVLGDLQHPLASWSLLLQEVARRVGCRLEPSECKEPTLAWEKLLSQYVRKKRGELSVSEAEKPLKQAVAEVLREATAGSQAVYRAHAITRQVEAFLARGGGHLISLNFDQLCYDGSSVLNNPVNLRKGADGVRKPDLRLLHERIVRKAGTSAPSMIWHPHGCIRRFDSIRLGYRDYGLLPASYLHAFAQFKRWESERTKSPGKSGRQGSKDFRQRLLDALESLDCGPKNASDRAADHWVTRFMVLPVQVIGAGISEHELGLRWLFVQRQRNFQRHPENGPPIFHRELQPFAGPWMSDVVDHSSWSQAWYTVFGPPAYAALRRSDK